MHTLIDSDGFRAALVVGAIAVLVVAGLRFRNVMRIGASAVVVVAMLAGLRAHDALSLRLVLSVLLLVVGGAALREWWLPVRMFMLTPGALLLASVLSGIDTWVRVLVFVVTVAAAPLAATFDRKIPRLLPLLLFISAIGVYICVPDTEIAAALVGATALPVLLGLDPRLRAMTGATAAATGLLVYVAAIGGYGRPGAVVGGMACLGALVVAPLTPAFFRRWTRASRTLPNVVALTVVHAGLVLFVARVAGFRESAWEATGLSALAFAVAWLVLAVVIRGRRRTAPA